MGLHHATLVRGIRSRGNGNAPKSNPQNLSSKHQAIWQRVDVLAVNRSMMSMQICPTKASKKS